MSYRLSIKTEILIRRTYPLVNHDIHLKAELQEKWRRNRVRTNDKLIYLFFSSSFLCFSMAVFCSIDPRLELEDLWTGDSEELLLLCLLYRFAAGDRLLWRLGVAEGLLWPLGEIERLFRLYDEQMIISKRTSASEQIYWVNIKPAHRLQH